MATEQRPDESSELDPECVSRDGPQEGASDVKRVVADWAPLLERYLRRHASRQILAHESAADLAQSVCREALERLDRGDLVYRGDAPMKQWLFGAADLKVRNRLRYYGAQKRAAENDGRERGPGAMELALDKGPSPSADVMREEERAAFGRALDQLEPRQREVVRLFHFDGLNHAELGDRLGISASHSRTLLARSLARLTRIMGADVDPPNEGT